MRGVPPVQPLPSPLVHTDQNPSDRDEIAHHNGTTHHAPRTTHDHDAPTGGWL